MKEWLRRLFRDEPVRRIEILEMKPGDVLVLATDRSLRPETRANVEDTMTKIRQGSQVMVLDGGFELRVIRNWVRPPAFYSPNAARRAAWPSDACLCSEPEMVCTSMPHTSGVRGEYRYSCGRCGKPWRFTDTGQ